MHPAFSVIFLSTLIGVGQGLFLALYTGQIYAMMHLLPTQESHSFYAVGSVLAFFFLAAGLFASIFHLGRPMRGWRAMSQWRTSWLSREVIILPVTLCLVGAYAACHYFSWTTPFFTLAETYPIDPSLVVGAVATISTFALFLCTGMVYAGLKFLQAWYTPLTILNYVLLGGASGFTLAAAFSAYLGTEIVSFYALWAILLTSIAFMIRLSSLIRNSQLKSPSTLQTAIGVRHSIIAQKTQGAMCGSFNTREFFHHQSDERLKTVKTLFLFLVFPTPISLIILALSGIFSVNLLISAFIIQYFGLIFERWYFFTEASHPQNLYYQTVG
ncbi:MAG: dimethyl sulfoxide reductase anchor subunit [Thiomargarita sp.]|nr:dimethyl sulfoxide reductase anchor subunit [Thiomargarita sp.]